MSFLRIRAATVLPIAGPAIRDGAVLVGEEGRIAEIGEHRDVPAPENAELVELNEAILMPGLVNLHTHLELTGMNGMVDDDDFADWIRHIKRAKEEQTEDSFLEAAKRGVKDAWAAGITTVADTGDTGSVAYALFELEASGVVYQEVFGPHPDQVPESMKELERRIAELGSLAGRRLSVGVSPHAPYTVSGPLYSAVSEFAGRYELPMALHIAESNYETELITKHTGAFAEAWKQRGIPLPKRADSPVKYLHEFGVLERSPLAIHAVQVDDEDLSLLEQYNCPIALCPRSNVRHGHGEPPIRMMRSHNLAMGVGTDSVASVDTLDMFAEMREVGRLGGLKPYETLQLATGSGADAIGLADVGRLKRGAWADMIAIQPSENLEGWIADPEARVLDADPTEVARTYLSGRMVFCR
ncbi:MAG: amidohydrolase family protein [Gemmatimonadota bacterium]|nr:amidohydrolase family protein [Gemmatimonadota bacterium]